MKRRAPARCISWRFSRNLQARKAVYSGINIFFPVLGNPQLEGMGLDRDLRKPVRDLIEDAWLACVKEEEGFEIRVREDLTRLLLLLGGKYPASAGKEKGGRGKIQAVQ